VLLGLTTDQKLGLAGTATVFIAFALVAALLIPRYRPDFPGRKGLGLFVVLTVLLTVAMLGAVVVWANEEHGAEAAGHAETHETGTVESETTETNATGQTEPTTTAEEQAGDPAAGRSAFASAGCGSCHTVAAANATGSVGPNLDESLQGKDAGYVERAIVDPNADVAEGYSAGVMPSFDDQLSDEQVDDLVAFLLQG
jgi:mono/diheme cytochrome c family protein